MPPIKESYFMFTIVVDVFITEFCIFQQVTMQPNPISLKIKTENKTIKRMEISDSLRNPPPPKETY